MPRYKTAWWRPLANGYV